MAISSNVDLSGVEGSGKNGIVLKEDIMALMGFKPAPSERKLISVGGKSKDDKIETNNCEEIERGPRKCGNAYNI